ncbi:hypothetical protein F5B22DRAFT_646277 [Xylaria bambusicola]|uniref:uncharacterized protein n=1 Tax=Xylaria bambusicola TaxID=326684 RepID=UPI0020080CC5|nr:uncharacterized protein F5B22DRAFT_646277 [Xylaria bambusicola]KAI0516932.1 hypothetical protein F5B22DRAFT_646277 [Xylaria bambusicola]
MPSFSSRRGPFPSKYLPFALESELRQGVCDAVKDFRPPAGNTAPQIIIGNPESGCHGTYFRSRHGTQFIFNHCKMKHVTQCNCRMKEAVGEATLRLPDDLDEYRIRLIQGQDVPYPLEPRLAAMVVMKIFLGMKVPAPLRMSFLEDAERQIADAEPPREEKEKEKASLEE